jgi:23S rRNA (guanosine2251-2'-O)-methyltransferase
MAKPITLYGRHAVLAALANPKREIIELTVQSGREEDWHQQAIKEAKRRQIRIERADRNTLEKRVLTNVHQGLVANVMPLPSLSDNDLQDLVAEAGAKSFLLFLDNIQDPHNLGACMRSAEAAGVTAVVIGRSRTVDLTAVACKAASGAAERVPFIQVSNLVRAMQDCQEQGVWFYGLAGEADGSLFQTKLSGAVGLVMGAEGQGLRRLTRETCDGLLSIPMLGEVASLNVSVATGVALFEVVRQRSSS